MRSRREWIFACTIFPHTHTHTHADVTCIYDAHIHKLCSSRHSGWLAWGAREPHFNTRTLLAHYARVYLFSFYHTHRYRSPQRGRRRRALCVFGYSRSCASQRAHDDQSMTVRRSRDRATLERLAFLRQCGKYTSTLSPLHAFAVYQTICISGMGTVHILLCPFCSVKHHPFTSVYCMHSSRGVSVASTCGHMRLLYNLRNRERFARKGARAIALAFVLGECATGLYGTSYYAHTPSIHKHRNVYIIKPTYTYTHRPSSLRHTY